jgi:hypothetical protein
MYRVDSNPQVQGIRETADQNGRNPASGFNPAPVAQGIERCPAEAEAARSNRAGRIIRGRFPGGACSRGPSAPLGRSGHV